MGVWDTAALPAREQFGYWHEVICQAFVPLTPHRTVDEEGFSARVETRPLVEFLEQALAYPVIEGRNIGVRRRQLQDLFLSPGYDPLAASGMS